MITKLLWLHIVSFALYTLQIVLATLRAAAVILWPWYWIWLPLLIALIFGVVVSLWFLIVWRATK